MSKVSIIILSFNTQALIDKCLQSIYKFIPHKLFEVIVVDNNSIDESVKLIKRKYPQVKIIKSEKNLGFAKGINLGFKYTSNQYILLLNSDSYFIDNSLPGMIEYMDKNHQTAVCGGAMINKDGSYQRSYGRFYTLLNSLIMLFFGDKAEKGINYGKKERQVDWVSGGFMLVKKDIFTKLNGFDENFFMYMEDMEFCLRIHKAGYLVSYFPDSKVVHLNQGSSNRSFAVVNIYKGLLYYFRKHKTLTEYCIVKVALWFKALVLIILGTVSGNNYLKKTYIRAIS